MMMSFTTMMTSVTMTTFFATVQLTRQRDPVLALSHVHFFLSHPYPHSPPSQPHPSHSRDYVPSTDLYLGGWIGQSPGSDVNAIDSKISRSRSRSNSGSRGRSRRSPSSSSSSNRRSSIRRRMRMQQDRTGNSGLLTLIDWRHQRQQKENEKESHGHQGSNCSSCKLTNRVRQLQHLERMKQRIIFAIRSHSSHAPFPDVPTSSGTVPGSGSTFGTVPMSDASSLSGTVPASFTTSDMSASPLPSDTHPATSSASVTMPVSSSPSGKLSESLATSGTLHASSAAAAAVAATALFTMRVSSPASISLPRGSFFGNDMTQSEAGSSPSPWQQAKLPTSPPVTPLSIQGPMPSNHGANKTTSVRRNLKERRKSEKGKRRQRTKERKINRKQPTKTRRENGARKGVHFLERKLSKQTLRHKERQEGTDGGLSKQERENNAVTVTNNTAAIGSYNEAFLNNDETNRNFTEEVLNIDDTVKHYSCSIRNNSELFRNSTKNTREFAEIIKNNTKLKAADNNNELNTNYLEILENNASPEDTVQQQANENEEVLQVHEVFTAQSSGREFDNSQSDLQIRFNYSSAEETENVSVEVGSKHSKQDWLENVFHNASQLVRQSYNDYRVDFIVNRTEEPGKRNDSEHVNSMMDVSNVYKITNMRRSDQMTSKNRAHTRGQSGLHKKAENGNHRLEEEEEEEEEEDLSKEDKVIDRLKEAEQQQNSRHDNHLQPKNASSKYGEDGRLEFSGSQSYPRTDSSQHETLSFRALVGIFDDEPNTTSSSEDKDKPVPLSSSPESDTKDVEFPDTRDASPPTNIEVKNRRKFRPSSNERRMSKDINLDKSSFLHGGALNKSVIIRESVESKQGKDDVIGADEEEEDSEGQTVVSRDENGEYQIIRFSTIVYSRQRRQVLEFKISDAAATMSTGQDDVEVVSAYLWVLLGDLSDGRRDRTDPDIHLHDYTNRSEGIVLPFEKNAVPRDEEYIGTEKRKTPKSRPVTIRIMLVARDGRREPITYFRTRAKVTRWQKIQLPTSIIQRQLRSPNDTLTLLLRCRRCRRHSIHVMLPLQKSRMLLLSRKRSRSRSQSMTLIARAETPSTNKKSSKLKPKTTWSKRRNNPRRNKKEERRHKARKMRHSKSTIRHSKLRHSTVQRIRSHKNRKLKQSYVQQLQYSTTVHPMSGQTWSKSRTSTTVNGRRRQYKIRAPVPFLVINVRNKRMRS